MYTFSFTDCQWIQWIACYTTWKPKIGECIPFVICSISSKISSCLV